MTTKTLSTSDLAQFTGSENWYRHGINRNVLYTDGAQHVAEHGGAYWLLDEIAIVQPYNKAVAAEEFQVWKLAVRPDRSATLTCDDGNGNIVFTKEIEHTDFPLDELTLYFANNVIWPLSNRSPPNRKSLLAASVISQRQSVILSLRDCDPFYCRSADRVSRRRSNLRKPSEPKKSNFRSNRLATLSLAVAK